MTQPRRLTLGVIADDFTGATDVASMLVRAGMRTVQLIGVPGDAQPVPRDVDAVVIALKTRTVPAADAVAASLAALRWLQRAGMRQCYFKFCSTFDSTPGGNIGPVAEALMAALDTSFTIACPAFPENGRTVFRGHLFVGDLLLSDSGMRDHPLTPMHDASLVRVLQAQCRGRVGLLPRERVAAGAAEARAQCDALRRDGVRIAIADAITDDDLRMLAAATAEFPLVTAASGLALGLPAAYAERGWLQPDAQAAVLDAVDGRSAVLAGSCSLATNAQVQRWREAGHAAFAIDPMALARGEAVARDALAWAGDRIAREPVLLYASASPHELKVVQQTLGAARAGALVEGCFGELARGLVGLGVRRLVVAGGETSGAVVQALGVATLRIGPTICPGVPWTQADDVADDGARVTLHLALKSGNFGGADFFDEALREAVPVAAPVAAA